MTSRQDTPPLFTPLEAKIIKNLTAKLLAVTAEQPTSIIILALGTMVNQLISDNTKRDPEETEMLGIVVVDFFAFLAKYLVEA